MATTSSTTIQKITTTGQTNPSWVLDIPVYDADDLWVWKYYTSTGVLEKLERGLHYTVSISGSVGTLHYIGTTGSITSHLRVQRQMKRVQHDEYKTGNRNATYLSYEQSLDKLAMKNQQGIPLDPKKPSDWTAGHEWAEDTFYRDRINDVTDGTADTDAVTKSQVDTALGGGTTPPTIASADVGQWITANSSNTSSWEDFTGTDDPKGNEYKYYTVAGWVAIGNMPTITGSGDNGKLLMDINGVATWTTPNEYLTTFADSATATHGRPYTIKTHSSARVSTVRDYVAAEKLLPNTKSQRLTSVETDWSSAVNKTEFGRGFSITNHSEVCLKRPTSSVINDYYSGQGEQCDHPVYLGTIANPFSSAVFPFFTSQHHQIPNADASGLSEDRWFVGEAYSDYTATGLESNGGFAWVFNIVSITADTITFVASSLLHETSDLPDSDGHTDAPFDSLTLTRFLKHPESVTINFNVLWYEQR
jgi:hypothetical protein